MKKIAYATAAALGLAGCVVGAPMTTYHTTEPYVFFSYAASRGIIPVMVVGEPYPGRRAEVEAAAVTALDRNFRSLGSPFRAVPPAPGEGTKVVILFNVPGYPQASAVCQDPVRAGTGGRTSGATMTARAVYCGVGPYSEYWLSFPAPSSPDDPLFHQRMLQLIYFAVPRDPEPSRRLGDGGPQP